MGHRTRELGVTPNPAGGPGQSDPKSIEIRDTGIQIKHLDIPSKDVAEFLRRIPESERVLTLTHAIEVGVFCLERASAGQDLDFVRRQIQDLLNSVQGAVEKIPEDTQKSLSAKIGTGDGQVLAPIHALVGQVAKAATDKIQEVKDLLSQEIDPTRESSTIGKALSNLRELLDPQRKDSIQGSLDTAIQQVTAEGGPLAKTVKQVVVDSVKPLREEVDALAKEVRGREAAEEALAQTTHKGMTYEDRVVEILQGWASQFGGEVHHVGTDNQPGDVVVNITESSALGVSMTIVVEARDRTTPSGRLAITKDMNTAMSTRSATAGIYVSRTQQGLGKEIGEWAEGACEYGRFVACTHEHLITGLRLLIALEQLAKQKTGTPNVDSASIAAQVLRVRTALGRIKNINTKVTDIRGSAEAIQSDAVALRDEIRDALAEVEEALRASPPNA